MKAIRLMFFLVLIVLDSNASDTTRVVLKLSFVGDIMQHGPQIKSAYNPEDDNYDYLPSLRTISTSLRQSDITIANLELTLAGQPYSGYPTFSAPDELAVAIKKSGIDVIVTANNHSLDRRKIGLERTIDVLDSLQIPFTGTFKNLEEREKKHPLMINKKGVKIALLNYTYGTNGIPVTEPNIVNLLDTAHMRMDLGKAKIQGANLIIVFTHWGWEYNRLPNEEQKMLTAFCKKNGADMVIGSHPHVLQPIEKQGDFIVVYSLGNFVSNQRDRYKDGGMIFSATVEFDLANGTKSITEAGYELTWVYKRKSEYGNKYFILPAAHPNSIKAILDQPDKENLQQFINDSRTHFQKYNKGNIIEYKNRLSPQPHIDLLGNYTFGLKSLSRSENYKKQKITNLKETVPKDPLVKKSKTVYRIQFLVSGKNYIPSSFDKTYFTNVFTEKTGGMTRYLTGNFETQEEAEDQLLLIRNETKYKDAYVVERVLD